MTAIVLLGPQRLKPTVASIVEDLGVSGSIAAITAGWEERESEDDELAAHFGGRTINLELHRRSETAFAEDPDLFEARRRMRDRRRQLRQVYRRRLAHTMEAVRELDAMTGDPDLMEPERRSALDELRRLDDHFLERVTRIRADARAEWRPLERPAVARQRREIEQIVEKCSAIAIAGGHVGQLLDVLSLFGFKDLIEDRHVLAWSAGAMALGQKIVLFHDRPPQGRGTAEIMDAGLGLYEDFLPLPHARRRLDLEDRQRVSIFADRFAPLACAAMDEGSWVVIQSGAITSTEGARRLTTGGEAVDFA